MITGKCEQSWRRVVDEDDKERRVKRGEKTYLLDYVALPLKYMITGRSMYLSRSNVEALRERVGSDT